MTPSESWEPKNLLRTVRKARRFPDTTCPASRHVQLMAEGLLKKSGYPMLTDEPEHCAASMLAACANLYDARTRGAKLREALFALHEVCLRMDCEGIDDRPTEQEYLAAMKRASANIATELSRSTRRALTLNV